MKDETRQPAVTCRIGFLGLTRNSPTIAVRPSQKIMNSLFRFMTLPGSTKYKIAIEITTPKKLKPILGR
jgi:hypothetical protein